MTCIVGIADGDSVYMGGDRGVSDDNVILKMSRSKVTQHGDFIIGYSGSLGVGQLMEFITYPKVTKATDVYKTIKIDLVEQVKSLYESHSRDIEDNGTDWLIGCKGRLFEFSSADWGVLEIQECSIGTGSPIALGSLYTSREIEDNPIIRITYALNAACELSPTCSLPVDILYI
jgi:ATP-dependent protease HslVU (ClpYQ) peptidase subunit